MLLGTTCEMTDLIITNEDGDEKSDHDNDQTTEVNEAELELCCNQSASEADIDLD